MINVNRNCSKKSARDTESASHYLVSYHGVISLASFVLEVLWAVWTSSLFSTMPVIEFPPETRHPALRGHGSSLKATQVSPTNHEKENSSA